MKMCNFPIRFYFHIRFTKSPSNKAVGKFCPSTRRQNLSSTWRKELKDQLKRFISFCIVIGIGRAKRVRKKKLYEENNEMLPVTTYVLLVLLPHWYVGQWVKQLAFMRGHFTRSKIYIEVQYGKHISMGIADFVHFRGCGGYCHARTFKRCHKFCDFIAYFSCNIAVLSPINTLKINIVCLKRYKLTVYFCRGNQLLLHS